MDENENDLDVNDDEHDDEEKDDPQPVRRSKRVSMKPSYLDYYILLAEVECERL